MGYCPLTIPLPLLGKSTAAQGKSTVGAMVKAVLPASLRSVASVIDVDPTAP